MQVSIKECTFKSILMFKISEALQQTNQFFWNNLVIIQITFSFTPHFPEVEKNVSYLHFEYNLQLIYTILNEVFEFIH